MKRKGIHQPTIEDAIEISGIETLHPGGLALTQRTADLAGLKPGMRVLDVSSGRGSQAIYYAQTFGVQVVGIDISEQMITAATQNAKRAGIDGQVLFRLADSRQLPFGDNCFDAVINECAVGIPDDSQKVLDEMVRVAKPGAAVAIHESTWRKPLSLAEKNNVSERYGTTPLEFDEWITMLKQAGLREIIAEFDQWSNPEMFWKIRKNRNVQHHRQVLSLYERIWTSTKIFGRYGLKGLLKAFENERVFFRAVLNGKLGYCLFKGVKH
ncbi:MAG: methyltransferase domain-containing protein [Desulfobacterales bacterium]|nr:MAG: methyltransferase domain-containing protein [Desulfobacterales bacterium]